MLGGVLPYQCLEISGDLLFAARGSSVDIISINDSSLISTWSLPRLHKQGNTTTLARSDSPKVIDKLPHHEEKSEPAPPAKKRKLALNRDEAADDTSSLDKDGSKTSSADVQEKETPAITIMASTRNGSYVAAVTGEDKTIRVLEIVQENQVKRLVQISHRSMPKRPCAITITNDDTTIISADKFGDVYSIPLLYKEKNSQPHENSQSLVESSQQFKPAASELTIHSQRNRRTLENQRKQTVQKSSKAGTNFDHELLLGHVSMLTDIKLAHNDQSNYIITSDRDEHIRISRGIPQTHVIENFCLGHTEFISRLCIPETRPKILISGGGDNEIMVWDWTTGCLLSKANMMEHVSVLKKKLNLLASETADKDSFKIAVSNICHTYTHNDLIIISYESIPAFFTFILTPEDTLQYVETIETTGNVLSMVVTKEPDQISSSIFVSVDNIHTPGSTSTPKESYDLTNIAALSKFQVSDCRIKKLPLAIEIPPNDTQQSSDSNLENLSRLFYGIESLRKKSDGHE
ncbi:tRNA methyltransferase [Blumeria hordei DH14]|uniref:tRNA methyltransferase n=1 Tax=Blumeria graminis f. sp. hordei (strain DH14) TaxID=546991 RepID=N1J802_BLUG1|nr:tRNA methyltransferase [Blumeria hordei DH14]